MSSKGKFNLDAAKKAQSGQPAAAGSPAVPPLLAPAGDYQALKASREGVKKVKTMFNLHPDQKAFVEQLVEQHQRQNGLSRSDALSYTDVVSALLDALQLAQVDVNSALTGDMLVELLRSRLAGETRGKGRG